MACKYSFPTPVQVINLRLFQSTYAVNAAYKSGNGAPTRGGKWFLCLFVPTRREIPQPVPTNAFLQPAKGAAMCTAPHAETCPPTPIPPFVLAQNLSSKRIAPTDNMRPKSDDTKWASSVVKRLRQLCKQP